MMDVVLELFQSHTLIELMVDQQITSIFDRIKDAYEHLFRAHTLGVDNGILI